MIKSFLIMGTSTKGRAVRISFRLPPKNFSSVRIERAEAPAARYDGTISSGRASCLIHPLDGERRLNSAIIPESEEANARFIEREAGTSLIPSCNCSMEIACFCKSTSNRLLAIISDNISFINLKFRIKAKDIAYSSFTTYHL